MTEAMREGRSFDAAEAVRFGLVDEIARPGVASVHHIERTELGFAPPRNP